MWVGYRETKIRSALPMGELVSIRTHKQRESYGPGKRDVLGGAQPGGPLAFRATSQAEHFELLITEALCLTDSFSFM